MKRLILLADDSPTIQRLVAQTFHDGNFEVVAVSNGDAAIRKFEEVRPELVLADIYMPGKNGYEVCAVVKKHPELGGTPVVLLAGAFDAYDEETASQVGAAAHITKPFEPHALVNLVVSLLPKEAPKRAVASAAQPVTSTIPHPASMPKESALPVSAPPTPVTPVAPPAKSAGTPRNLTKEAETGDLLGLNALFQPPAAERLSAASFSDELIDRIADRVIKKLSTQVIESVAWDVVPEITAKVLREELKRQS
ncbi:MAG TPA: response regulator [Terriglobia bacterium]|nr:response regulator [Terriglobia bacterium]